MEHVVPPHGQAQLPLVQTGLPVEHVNDGP